MGANTKIEWTNSTWSPIRARNLKTGNLGWHCERVSEGCKNCYSSSMNRRLGTGLDFKPGHRADVEIFLDEKMLLAPLRWKTPRRIFVNSMTDTFAEFVKDEWIDRMFAVMALCPQHTFQVLTKRPDRMRAYCAAIDTPARVWPLACEMGQPGRALSATLVKFGSPWPLPNVWLGISAEDQATADERIPLLLQTPAAVRFVSLEPLLGPIKLWWLDDDARAYRGPGVRVSGGVITVGTPDCPPERYDDSQPWLDWVIVGGESGPHARPLHPRWARDLRDQCATAGVPFFFKQWGQHRPPTENDPAWRSLGKKAAGRLLDGRTHDEMPS